MSDSNVKLFCISDRIFLEILQGKVEVKGLPEDFRMIAVCHSFERNAFLVKGISQEFAAIIEGELIPEIAVEFHRKPEQECAHINEPCSMPWALP